MEIATAGIAVERHTAITAGVSALGRVVLFRPRDRRDESSREQVVRRVRSEFQDMPGLRLTLAQARRLFGLREDICARVLATLVSRASLRRDGSGAFVRNDGRP